MIKSFKCKETEKIFNNLKSLKLPFEIQRNSKKKLIAMNHSQSLSDLSNVPSNRLEKLQGNRKDQWSIRINNQWRICFYWNGEDFNDVEIVDYH